ncbi:MAG: hypothetical protein KGI51_14680 [Rhodospirillales bacterium]|nr:hypothetical protein [Rhodospirillales bacterium]
MRIPAAICVVLLLGLAACAEAPSAIAPEYVSSVPYDSWSCPQLESERANIATALAGASANQDEARTDDTIGVLLIGLPMGSMSGENIAPQIAHLKGQAMAVQEAALRNGCPI